MESVTQVFGVPASPLRRAIALLSDGWQEFDDLVRDLAAPRRSVEELLTALGGDLERDGTAVRLCKDAIPGYRELAGRPADAGPEFTETVARYLADVPPPLPALDHVQATTDTVVRRARWLDEHFDLRSARLTFVGDHDLTSLAVRALRPEANLTVIDVDDRILEYIDRHSDRTIHTVHADLRFGLPLAVTGKADVVFSDPPYTPEGMGLFAARGLDCLADPPNGRLVLAYGYSPRHPALGHQAQRALLALGLTFEAIVPGFHRYTGAQAIGSAADLYVCQPTAKAKKVRKGKQTIYTHGPQSVEARDTPPALRDALVAIAGETGLDVDLRTVDWTKPASVPRGTAVAVDLSGDPGPWLLRTLLAVNADRVAVLVPNAHPDLADAEAQRALSTLLAPKYRLRLLRSTPDNTHAVVVATAVPAADTTTAVHAVLTRAHGRLGNLWPSAPDDIADLRLIDLPRHRIAEAGERLAGA
ncbi:bis-aminopropyl spermidine synthase family protein [Prauserella oleivorans]|uniref:Bis-aminopropyl spermidine synthase family protein n=1 Tax=Prauserella oleivorans TaxID=1478153 RepID=A0ABW5WFP6_9PSEU